MARLFISYSRVDEVFARRLATDLAHLGADIWIDVDDIPAGMDWSNAIQEGLDSGDVMLLILSPSSSASRNVEAEWKYFWDQERPIIPILWEPTKVHFQLHRLQYINFHKQDYDKALRQLHGALTREGIRLEPIAVREVAIPVQAPLPVKETPRVSRTVWVVGAVAVLILLGVGIVLLNNVWGGGNEDDNTPVATLDEDAVALTRVALWNTQTATALTPTPSEPAPATATTTMNVAATATLDPSLFSGPEIDLVLLLDVTGNMSEALDVIQNNAEPIINDLYSLQPNLRYALAIYGDYPQAGGGEGDTPFQLVVPFTQDFRAFTNRIGDVSLQSGGDIAEAGWRALSEVAALDWRPHASKAIIVITESSAHDPDPGPDEQLGTADDLEGDAVTQLLKNNEIIVFGVDLSNNDARDFLRPLAETTGGRYETHSVDEIPEAILEFMSRVASPS